MAASAHPRALPSVAISPIPDALIGDLLRADAKRIGTRGVSFQPIKAHDAARAVLRGRVAAAITLAFPPRGGVVQEVLGHHIAVVVVQASRPLRNLTAPRLEHVLGRPSATWAGVDGGTGTVQLWAGPKNAARELLVTMLRSGPGSSVKPDIVLRLPSSARGQDRNTTALLRTREDEHSMAVVSLASLSYDRALRTVPIDNVTPSRRAHLNRRYPYGRALVLIHRKGKPDVARAITRHLVSPAMRQVLARRITL